MLCCPEQLWNGLEQSSLITTPLYISTGFHFLAALTVLKGKDGIERGDCVISCSFKYFSKSHPKSFSQVFSQTTLKFDVTV